MDKIRSQPIRELETEALEEYIEDSQLGWLGHLFIMKNAAKVKKVWKDKLQGKIEEGTPEKNMVTQ